ncbi:MAG: non-homologous end-joining DNA ligase [Actinomycetota bacterium]
MSDSRSHIAREVSGRALRVSNPDKVYFPEIPLTKLELVDYYLEVGDAVLRGCLDRPCILRRMPNGVDGDTFYQKRVPRGAPEWLKTATIRFPSGRSAQMVVMADLAHVVWAVNLGSIDIHPWPVRDRDVDHPDEIRFDLDPTPEVPFDDVRETALITRDVLAEFGLEGFAKTSGKRGIHVLARIEPTWSFSEVRTAAVAGAREIERRADGIATTKWWKEERFGVFVDYNQNARDRTTASAYSVRPVQDARVSTPLTWDEVEAADPGLFTVATVPGRLRKVGDPSESIDSHSGSLAGLLELAEEQERSGDKEAPLPPHFPKGEKEPRRVAPSRRARGQRRKSNPQRGKT